MPLGKKKAPVLETQNEKPRERNSLGFSIPFLYGGLNHRLVTDYLSPSNHFDDVVAGYTSRDSDNKRKALVPYWRHPLSLPGIGAVTLTL